MVHTVLAPPRRAGRLPGSPLTARTHTIFTLSLHSSLRPQRRPSYQQQLSSSTLLPLLGSATAVKHKIAMHVQERAKALTYWNPPVFGPLVDWKDVKLNVRCPRDDFPLPGDYDYRLIMENTVLLIFHNNEMTNVSCRLRADPRLRFEQLKRFFSYKMDSYTIQWRFMLNNKQLSDDDTPLSLGIARQAVVFIEVYRTNIGIPLMQAQDEQEL
uniref:Ubiquitin-like domain-containing protein n=1 Tax=Steinernema glaseri TaxID=37863 RepID=A0A1I8APG4_9BILA